MSALVAIPTVFMYCCRWLSIVTAVLHPALVMLHCLIYYSDPAQVHSAASETFLLSPLTSIPLYTLLFILPLLE
jgi:hypothetical protein